MPLHSLADMASDKYNEAWLPGPQSTQFYTRTYLAAADAPAKATLVFVHGFAEHVGRYTEAHPEFAARGINVFTFDERGFGKTALDEHNKSKTSSYAKTSGVHQLDDIKWALDHAEKEFPGLPLFLAGHSMGGGEVLNFSARRSKDAVAMLSGVIACSPIVHQTHPASKLQRWVGGKVANFLPYITIPAPLNFDHLSHDAVYNEMCRTDPLAKLQGTLRALSDMLNWGEELLTETYKSWPKSLPILFVHGTGDEITSHLAAEQFYQKIVSDDKNMITYADGYHELLHEPAHREKLIKDMVAFIDGHLEKPDAQAKL
ncbi:lysophospholipase [Mycena metata]|uniref:Lysophospholipase n=1 Tax=Mycena metata TaxID=1033252 RepID=A0AAD7IS27_9AGAR|nr:lysophospholipase [Mycena metata]